MLSLDIRETEENNWIPDEYHTIGEDAYIVELEQGVYYGDTITVYSVSEERFLVKGTEYKPVALCANLSLKYAVGLMYGLDFRGYATAGDLMISYRALGSYEGRGSEAFTALLNYIKNNSVSTMSWDDIDHPDSFAPVTHDHYFADIYGYDDLTYVLYVILKNVHLNNRLGYTGSRLSQQDVRLLNLLFQMSSRLNRITKTHTAEVIDATQEQVDDLWEEVTSLQKNVLELALVITTFQEDSIFLENVLLDIKQQLIDNSLIPDDNAVLLEIFTLINTLLSESGDYVASSGSEYLIEGGMWFNGWSTSVDITMPSWVSRGSTVNVQMTLTPETMPFAYFGDIEVAKLSSNSTTVLSIVQKEDTLIGGSYILVAKDANENEVLLARNGWNLWRSYADNYGTTYTGDIQGVHVNDDYIFVVQEFGNTVSLCIVYDHTGSVVGQFDLGETIPFISSIAEDSNGGIWLVGADTDVIVKVDVSDSIVNGTATILATVGITDINSPSIAFAVNSADNTEYMVLAEYRTSLVPYLYFFDASLLSDGASIGIDDRSFRYAINETCQGVAFYGDQLYLSHNRTTADFSGARGKIFVLSDIFSGSDNDDLITTALDHISPAGLSQDIAIHNGVLWCGSEAYQTNDDFTLFNALWNMNLDKSVVSYTVGISYAAAVATVTLNGYIAGAFTNIDLTSVDTLSLGGGDGTATINGSYYAGVVSNLIIKRGALDGTELSDLTVADIAMLTTIDPTMTADEGVVSGWVATEGGVEVRSALPSAWRGDAYIFAGANAQTTATNTRRLSETGIDIRSVMDGNATVILKWRQASYSNTDGPSMGLIQKTKGSVELMSSTSEAAAVRGYDGAGGIANWKPLSLAQTLDVDCRLIVVEFACTRTAGTNNDGYIDAIEILAVDHNPNPEMYLGTGYRRAIRNDNPYAYWEFNETIGDGVPVEDVEIFDETGHFHGSYIGDCTPGVSDLLINQPYSTAAVSINDIATTSNADLTNLSSIGFPVIIETVMSIPEAETHQVIFSTNYIEGFYSGIWLNISPERSISINLGDGLGADPVNRVSFLSDDGAVPIDTPIWICAIIESFTSARLYVMELDGDVSSFNDLATSTSGTAVTYSENTSHARLMISASGIVSAVAMFREVLSDDSLLRHYLSACDGSFDLENGSTSIIYPYSLKIINPSADDGTAAWTATTGSISTVVAAADSDTYFQNGSTVTSYATQTVDLSDMMKSTVDDGYIGYTLSFKTINPSGTTDRVGIKLIFLDEDGTSILENAAQQKTGGQTSEVFEFDGVIPSTARAVTIQAEFIYKSIGSAYITDIAVVLTERDDPYYRYDGDLGYYVNVGWPNLVAYSNTISKWSTYNSAVEDGYTIDGRACGMITATASGIGNSSRRPKVSLTDLGSTMYVTLVVHAGNTDYLLVGYGINNAYYTDVYFNLSTGSYISGKSGSTIEDLGNGWFKVKISFTFAAGDSTDVYCSPLSGASYGNRNAGDYLYVEYMNVSLTEDDEHVVTNFLGGSFADNAVDIAAL